MNYIPNLTYFIYARKSSESEDKQVQSIDDQVRYLENMAADRGIVVKDVLTEAKSAKEPGNREIFDRMLESIKNGEANAILCWQINRLSRNPIDSANIQWLLQQGVLKKIQTMDREYRPEDNALLLSVESGIANQYIIDLRKNTLRGIESKLEKGWHPNLAPPGYLNDKETKTIIPDPKRFDMVRRMWEVMLTGLYTPPQILEMANEEWGFRSRKTKRMGGNPLARSGIYKIFNNTFYAGIITYNGSRYPGNHEPMVTLEQFDRVQRLMGKVGKPAQRTHEFAYRGLIRCAECGCLFTAETKKKFIKKTEKFKYYTYYHCTRKKRGVSCSQKKSIREDKLDQQIAESLYNVTIHPQFYEWGMEALNEYNDHHSAALRNIRETATEDKLKTQRELDNLVRMRFRELIGDEEFLGQKKILQDHIFRLQETIRDADKNAERLLKKTMNFLSFIRFAHDLFLNGDLETKKRIFFDLGSNLLMKDGKLLISDNSLFTIIKKDYTPLAEEFLRLELDKKRLNKAKTKAKEAIRLRWLRTIDTIRTKILEGFESIPPGSGGEYLLRLANAPLREQVHTQG